MIHSLCFSATLPWLRETSERVGNRFGENFCKSRERSDTGLVLLVSKELKERLLKTCRKCYIRTAFQIPEFPFKNQQSTINNFFYPSLPNHQMHRILPYLCLSPKGERANAQTVYDSI
jgi:hypothetical protein